VYYNTYTVATPEDFEERDMAIKYNVRYGILLLST